MKIGLALSGGGVLGVAHIGILEELEKNNIKVDHIAGTSAGAIIAAVYASGGIENLNNFFEAITKLEYFGAKKPLKIVTPTKLFEQITKLVKKFTKENLEYMPIKLTILATDLGSGNETLFENGSTVEAVMASCAYPGVFPTQNVNGTIYIDGGVTRNLPSDALTDCDFLIGSNLYSIAEISKEKIKTMNRIQIISRTIDIYQKELAEVFAQRCNYCFDLKSASLKWYSFSRAREIRESGREQAREQISELIKLLREKA